MFRRSILFALTLLLQAGASAQRYIPDFTDEDTQKLFDKAERAYVKGNYERSAKLYNNLLAEQGQYYQLEFNHLTALVHTADTLAIEAAFRKLLDSPFLDCNYLSLNEDFKQIKYRKVFNLWKQAVGACQGKEQKMLAETAIQLPEVRTQLLWMKVQDVASDVQVIHKIRYDGYPDISYDSLKNFRAKIYEEQFEQLLGFVEEYGWLGKSLVGKDGAEAAWLIAQHGQHAPIEQVKLLPRLLAAAQSGEAKMSQYAHLFDLVCSHHRRPQRYGTLRWENPDTSNWEIYPIEEPDKVNEYRQEAGLPPLKGY